MKNKPWLWLAGGIVLGAVVAPFVRSLPLLNKLPTVGGR